MIIPANWSLPDSIRSRISQTTYGRQRAIVEDGHVLIILHKPPGPDDRTRDSVLFWRNPAGEWHFNRGAAGSGNTALKRHVQTYVDVEAKLTQDYEKAAGTEALFNLLEELTPMSRATENMYLALQAAREAVKGDLFLIEVRDLAYEVSRNIDLLLEDVRNAIQYRAAREAEAQSHASREALQAGHRLNILAALFFPLTAITSVFGMNLRHGLDDQSALLFWVIFAAGVALGFFFKGWVLGKPVSRSKEKPIA
jgi:hypothetical protein